MYRLTFKNFSAKVENSTLFSQIFLLHLAFCFSLYMLKKQTFGRFSSIESLATQGGNLLCAVQVSGSDPPPKFPFSPFFFLIRPYGLNSRENRIFRSIGSAFYVHRTQGCRDAGMLYYPCSLRSNRPEHLGTSSFCRVKFIFISISLEVEHAYRMAANGWEKWKEWRKGEGGEEQREREKDGKSGRFCLGISFRTSELRQSPFQERLERREIRARLPAEVKETNSLSARQTSCRGDLLSSFT